MKITRKSEILFEVEFDEYEVKQLNDIGDVFGVEPVDILRKSFEHNLSKSSDELAHIMRMANDRAEANRGN